MRSGRRRRSAVLIVLMVGLAPIDWQSQVIDQDRPSSANGFMSTDNPTGGMTIMPCDRLADMEHLWESRSHRTERWHGRVRSPILFHD